MRRRATWYAGWLVATAALATVPAKSAIYRSWAVGQEREVDEGVYAKLVAQSNGWRLWQFETTTGKQCFAIKSAVGRPHPVPVGVSNFFTGGTPFLKLYSAYAKIYADLQGEHYRSTTNEFRAPGERFWAKISDETLSPLDGKTVDVHVISWEYREIMVGMADEKAKLSLAGLGSIKAQLLECERSQAS